VSADLAASIMRWDLRETFAPSASSMISKSRTDRVNVSFGFVICCPLAGSCPKHVALKADLFLRIKLAKEHADFADLRIDVFYHRGFIRIPAFERQKFQAVIHNRSNAVDFSVVEAMCFLSCHAFTFSLLSLGHKLVASLKK